MSRTPLFQLLRRSLRLAQSSRVTGESATDTLARWRASARLSRRELLGAALVTAAEAAVGGCIPVRPVRHEGHQAVVIVGAGIAGLTAGYRLRQAGMAVRIFEAQPRVGGRMFSLRRHFSDSQVVELGGEFVDSGHAHVRGLCSELGIQLDDLAEDEPALDSVVWEFGGAPRREDEIIAAFRPIAARIAADLATIGGDGTVTYRQPNGADALDRMSIAEWMHKEGVSGWIHDLLRVAYTTEYGVEIDKQSALNFLTLIDPRPAPFRVFGDSDERYRIRGGNDTLPSELAARLHDSIETGMALEAVREKPDGAFRCSFQRGASSVMIEAPHLVLAIPFTVLRQVELDVDLPPVKRRAIAALGYGTNAKLLVGFTQRFWRRMYHSNGSLFADLPFQEVWEATRGQRGSAGVLTNFTGGDHGLELGQGTPADQTALLLRQLEGIFPGIADYRASAREVRFHWPSFPYTQGSYAAYLVGQRTSISGAEGERVRRLHFAGEHCSLRAQGFMEGGCESGENVAASILSDLGLQRRQLRSV